MGYGKKSCQFVYPGYFQSVQLKELLDVSNTCLEESFTKELDILSNKYVNNPLNK